MGRASSIEQLPQELFDQVNRALNDGKTIEEVVAHLKLLGAELSKSAVGRHKKKIEEVGDRIRRSRMIAEAMGREFGDKPDNKLAQLNIELLHDQVMRLASAGENGEEANLTTKEARELSDAIYRLAAAQKFDADRVLKIRKDTAEKVMNEVEKVAKSDAAGLSADTLAKIRKQVLGVAG